MTSSSHWIGIPVQDIRLRWVTAALLAFGALAVTGSAQVVTQNVMVEASFKEPDPVATTFRSWALNGETGEAFVGTTLPGGTVRIYVEDESGVANLVQELPRPTTPTNSDFGRAIAVDGDRLLVGANTSSSPSGVVFEYQRDAGGAWVLVGNTREPQPATQIGFGVRLQLDGDVALMDEYVMERAADGVWNVVDLIVVGEFGGGGARLVGDSIFTADGQLTVRERRRAPDGTFPVFTEVEAPFGLVSQDAFGRTFDCDGETLVVSSTQYDSLNDLGGLVFLYRREFDGEWELVQTLALDDNQNDMGIAVAVEGDHVLVSALKSSNIGRAYLFRALDPWTWVPIAHYAHPASANSDKFGATIKSDAGVFLIDSPGPSSNTTSLHFARPATLMRDTRTISLGGLGSQRLRCRAPGGFESGWFALLGSASGTAPGLDLGGGLTLPLNFDAYLLATVNGAGPFVDGQAAFDAWGRAEVVIQVDETIDPGLVGIVVHHAYVAFAPSTSTFMVSNPVSLELVP